MLMISDSVDLDDNSPFKLQLLEHSKPNMAKKQLTLVYYHVPQDKDDPSVPNVFGIPQAKASIRLQHIYENFPLKGNYLFRFKCSYQGVTVWLDLPSPEAKIPMFRENIYMKATRVSWEDSKMHQQYRYKPTVQGASKTQQKIQTNLFDGPPQIPSKQSVPNIPKTNGSLLDDNQLNLMGQKANTSTTWPDLSKLQQVSLNQAPVMPSGFDLLGNNSPVKKTSSTMQGDNDLI